MGFWKTNFLVDQVFYIKPFMSKAPMHKPGWHLERCSGQNIIETVFAHIP